jgi:hypothetical protein
MKKLLLKILYISASGNSAIVACQVDNGMIISSTQGFVELGAKAKEMISSGELGTVKQLQAGEAKSDRFEIETEHGAVDVSYSSAEGDDGEVREFTHLSFR